MSSGERAFLFEHDLVNFLANGGVILARSLPVRDSRLDRVRARMSVSSWGSRALVFFVLVTRHAGDLTPQAKWLTNCLRRYP